jgi:hypothetical protein
MALSGHANPADPLWGNNGHDADVTRCLLMTQSRPDHVKPVQRRYLSGMTISFSVVSRTNMASSRAGFVELALALT